MGVHAKFRRINFGRKVVLTYQVATESRGEIWELHSIVWPHSERAQESYKCEKEVVRFHKK